MNVSQRGSLGSWREGPAPLLPEGVQIRPIARSNHVQGGTLNPVYCKFVSLIPPPPLQVADELVLEFERLNEIEVPPLPPSRLPRRLVFAFYYIFPQFQGIDEKNIRRRVYDALNVLMAMDVISRDKKEIRWNGLPSSATEELANLKVGVAFLVHPCACGVSSPRVLHSVKRSS